MGHNARASQQFLFLFFRIFRMENTKPSTSAGPLFHSTPKEEEDKKMSTSAFPKLLNIAYDLSEDLLGKLGESGIRYHADLEIISNKELVEQFGFTKAQIEEIDCKIRNLPNPEDLPVGVPLNEWQAEMQYIATGCSQLDAVFGGKGLPTGMLTQVAGEAGSGKTQFCMQLCFRVQLPEREGGLNGDALYIDTEDSFRPERLHQIAASYYSRRIANENQLNLKLKLREVQMRIHFRKVCTNMENFLEVVTGGELDAFLDAYSNIRLIVVDSVAYHFRFDYEGSKDVKTYQLTRLVKSFKEIAQKRNIAIFITNQVSMNNEPTLGPLWNSVCSTSLLLRRMSDEISIGYLDEKERELVNQGSQVTIISKRQCKVLKSCSTNPYAHRFYYILTAHGVEDLESK